MLKDEWKKLLSNKLLLVVVLAIIIIPTIYTTLFLGSMWDPYGSVENLPVAVVNHDKPVVYKDETLNVGEELVDNLKEDASMAFQEVDEETAQKGLAKGDYYMVITIPEDFSSNAATLTEDQPRKMQLNYQTNPGTNYIASKLSESAMKQIQTSVREEVTKTYTETMFEQLGTIEDGMQEAADGAGELKDGAVKLMDGNTTISDNLKVLADSTLTFYDGSKELAEGLSQYTAGVATVAEGAEKLDNGAGQLKDGIDKLGESAPALADGVTRLNEGAGALAEGAATAKNGSAALESGAAKVDDNLKVLNSGLGELKTQTAELPKSAAALNDGVGAAVAGTEKLQQGTKALEQGVNQVNAGANELNKGLQTIVGENNQNSAALVSGATQLKEGIDKLCKFLPKTEDVDPMVEALAAVQTQANEAAAKLGSVQAETQDPADLAQTLEANIEAAKNGDEAALAAVIDAANQAVAMAQNNGAAAQAATGACQQAAADLNGISTALGGSAEQPKTFGIIGQLIQGLKQLQEGATALQAGVTQYTDGVNAAAAGSSKLVAPEALPALAQGAAQVSGGVDTLKGGLDQLQAGTQLLAQQAPLLTGGIAQAAVGGAQLQQQGTSVLRAGTTQLSGGLDALVAGSNTLKDGMGTLNGQIPALTGGIGQLQDGAKALKDGTSTLIGGTQTLTANNEKLNSGAAALTDGASKISDGASQLHDGSLELGDGLSQVYDGAETLQDGLSDGVQEIRDTNTGDDAVNMFAGPVDVNETKLREVPNNGHGMAPYMMSVALWVGCIAFSLMYPLTEYYGKLKNGTAWWLSKASVLYLIALLQALVMIGSLHFFNGFAPAEMGKTIMVACVASLAFMSVMYFFTNLLGKVGSFIMLIFMVIQLAGSVGTYPLELSGSFVKYFHDWVPFTYTVKAFRSTICGGESVSGCLAYLMVWMVVFTLLTIVVFQVRAYLVKNDRPTFTGWLERHGLA